MRVVSRGRCVWLGACVTGARTHAQEESPASMPERWVNDPACYAAAVAEMFLDLLARNADQKRRVVLCGYSTGTHTHTHTHTTQGDRRT